MPNNKQQGAASTPSKANNTPSKASPSKKPSQPPKKKQKHNKAEKTKQDAKPETQQQETATNELEIQDSASAAPVREVISSKAHFEALKSENTQIEDNVRNFIKQNMPNANADDILKGDESLLKSFSDLFTQDSSVYAKNELFMSNSFYFGFLNFMALLRENGNATGQDSSLVSICSSISTILNSYFATTLFKQSGHDEQTARPGIDKFSLIFSVQEIYDTLNRYMNQFAKLAGSKVSQELLSEMFDKYIKLLKHLLNLKGAISACFLFTSLEVESELLEKHNHTYEQIMGSATFQASSPALKSQILTMMNMISIWLGRLLMKSVRKSQSSFYSFLERPFELLIRLSHNLELQDGSSDPFKSEVFRIIEQTVEMVMLARPKEKNAIVQYVTFKKPAEEDDVASSAGNEASAEEGGSLVAKLDLGQASKPDILVRRLSFVQEHKNNFLSSLFQAIFKILGKYPIAFIRYIDYIGMTFRYEFYIQLYHVAVSAVNKYQYSFFTQLKLTHAIFDSLLRMTSYPMQGETSPAYLTFKGYVDSLLHYLRFNTEQENEAEYSYLFKNLAVIIKIDHRPVTAELSSLWSIIFTLSESTVHSASMDLLFSALFSTYSLSRSLDKLILNYFKGWDSLIFHEQHMLRKNLAFKLPALPSLMESKTLRDSFKSAVFELPDGQIVPIFRQLLSDIDERLETILRSQDKMDEEDSDGEVEQSIGSNFAYKLSLLLFPLTTFGYNIVLSSTIISQLQEAAKDVNSKVVKRLLVIILAQLGKEHNQVLDTSLTASLQLYYAMSTVIKRSEEFSSDIFEYKPISLHKKEEDMLIRFEGNEGIPLSSFSPFFTKLSLKTKSILCYIIFQRMYELNQQMLLQAYNLITNTENFEQQEKNMRKNYQAYFQFIKKEFLTLNSSTSQSATRWSGFIESIDSTDSYMIMIWYLITNNFRHIISHLEAEYLNTIIEFAISVLLKGPPASKSSDDNGYSLYTITKDFWEDYDILSLQNTAAIVGQVIIQKLQQVTSSLIANEESDISTHATIKKTLTEICQNVQAQKFSKSSLSSLFSGLLEENPKVKKASSLSKLVRSSTILDSLLPFICKLPKNYFQGQSQVLCFYILSALEGALYHSLKSAGAEDSSVTKILEWLLMIRRSLVLISKGTISNTDTSKSSFSVSVVVPSQFISYLHQFAYLQTKYSQHGDVICRLFYENGLELLKELYTTDSASTSDYKDLRVLLKQEANKLRKPSLLQIAALSACYYSLYASLNEKFKLQHNNATQISKQLEKKSKILLDSETSTNDLIHSELEFVAKYQFTRAPSSGSDDLTSTYYNMQTMNLTLELLSLMVDSTGAFANVNALTSKYTHKSTILLIQALFEQAESHLQEIAKNYRSAQGVGSQLYCSHVCHYLRRLSRVISQYGKLRKATPSPEKITEEQQTLHTLFFATYHTCLRTTLQGITLFDQLSRKEAQSGQISPQFASHVKLELMGIWSTLIGRTTTEMNQQYASFKQILQDMRTLTKPIPLSQHVDMNHLLNSKLLLDLLKIICDRTNKVLLEKFYDQFLQTLYHFVQSFSFIQPGTDAKASESLFELFETSLDILRSVIKDLNRIIRRRKANHFLYQICIQILQARSIHQYLSDPTLQRIHNSSTTIHVCDIVQKICDITAKMVQFKNNDKFDALFIVSICKDSLIVLLNYLLPKCKKVKIFSSSTQEKVLDKNMEIQEDSTSPTEEKKVLLPSRQKQKIVDSRNASAKAEASPQGEDQTDASNTMQEPASSSSDKSETSHVFAVVMSLSQLYSAIYSNELLEDYIWQFMVDFIFSVNHHILKNFAATSTSMATFLQSLDEVYLIVLNTLLTNGGILDLLGKAEKKKYLAREIQTSVQKHASCVQFLNQLLEMRKEKRLKFF